MAHATLSIENWHDIFEHLSYFDLKNCQRVCKTFKALTEHSSHDAKLFRNRNFDLNDKYPVDKYSIHPVFTAFPRNKADCYCGQYDQIKYEQFRYLRGESQTGRYELTEALAVELATIPPCSTALLGFTRTGFRDRIGCEFCVRIQKENGVTVGDVLQAQLSDEGKGVFRRANNRGESIAFMGKHRRLRLALESNFFEFLFLFE